MELKNEPVLIQTLAALLNTTVKENGKEVYIEVNLYVAGIFCTIYYFWWKSPCSILISLFEMN
ncbi:hypothetical protein CS542_02800 [Pedobacter sp. IW39]|nr:hypothetical protein CS542_02800 [Pedobacter sp. IW39]